MSSQSYIFNPTERTSAAAGDGFSAPRLTTTDRLAITLGANGVGMMVYDTTLNNLFIWNGSAWESVPASGDAGANGAVQYNDNGIVTGATNFTYDKATGLVTGVRYLSSTSTGALPAFAVSAGNGFYNSGVNQIGASTNGVNAFIIDANQNLLVGAPSGTFHRILKLAATGAPIMDWVNYGSNGAVAVCTVDRQTYASANAANCALRVGDCTGGSRSINASGSINANGADYAEYMTKTGDFTIEKGDVAGIDANGKLTNVFADAVTFVVKSTDPSYVGNDNWGTGIEGAEFEAARELVDRIAFAGQVPVNVIGATAGDYIVPVVDGIGIKGIAVSSPTFDQYKLAVGKVITIEADGRARIIVKVA